MKHQKNKINDYFEKKYSYSRKIIQEKYKNRPPSKIRLKRMIDMCGDVRDKRVLDVGCGAGIASIELAKMGAKVTSFDLSHKAIKNLKEWAKEKNLYVDAIVCSIENFPLNKKFDIVISMESIMYNDDISTNIKKLISLTNIGGKIIVSVPNTWSWTSFFALFDYFPFSFIKKKSKNYSRHFPWTWKKKFMKLGIKIEKEFSIFIAPAFKPKKIQDYFIKSSAAKPFVLIDRFFHDKFPFYYIGYGYIFQGKRIR